MCGRYRFTAAQSEELREILRLAQEGAQGALLQGMQEQVRPTNLAPVVYAREGQAAVGLFRWGFPAPAGRGVLINARAETAGEKPLFRGCLQRGRCVVPSAGFYEWDEEKRCYLFALPGQDALYMAGLYRLVEGERRFVVLTTQANDSVRPVHSRMPVLLTRQEILPWLRGGAGAGALLERTPPALWRQAV